MTDRLKGFTVTLVTDIREDDAQQIADAILMIKGVLSVDVSVSNSDDWMNRERIKHELRTKLFDVLK